MGAVRAGARLHDARASLRRFGGRELRDRSAAVSKLIALRLRRPRLARAFPAGGNRAPLTVRRRAAAHVGALAMREARLIRAGILGHLRARRVMRSRARERHRPGAGRRLWLRTSRGLQWRWRGRRRGAYAEEMRRTRRRDPIVLDQVLAGDSIPERERPSGGRRGERLGDRTVTVGYAARDADHRGVVSAVSDGPDRSRARRGPATCGLQRDCSSRAELPSPKLQMLVRAAPGLLSVPTPVKLTCVPTATVWSAVGLVIVAVSTLGVCPRGISHTPRPYVPTRRIVLSGAVHRSRTATRESPSRIDPRWSPRRCSDTRRCQYRHTGSGCRADHSSRHGSACRREGRWWPSRLR